MWGVGLWRHGVPAPSSGPLSSGSSSRLQELYYEIVHVLSLMLEDLPQKKQSQSSEKADEK